MKNRGIVEIDYGLEIIEGLMGSGKSYFAVRRVCKVIEEQRRPVYTNLPLRWRVVRQYLRNRGGEELAQLIHRLDEKHWRRFLERQHTYARFLERMRTFKPGELSKEHLEQIYNATGEPPFKIFAQQKIYTRQFEAWFNHMQGEPQYEGPHADHIPPTALIVIDEVQHWHGMNTQMTDPNRDDLQAYLTMCRHHLHWIWVITQDSTRIAKLFRLLYKYNWRVWDRGEDRLAWGIRLKHLGFKGMGYQRYTPDQLEGTNPENRAASEQFTILPGLKRNRVFFRLYDSFTNVADKRTLQRAQRRARVLAGLDESGRTDNERKQQEEEVPKKPGIIKRITKTIRNAVLLVMLCSVAYAAGTIAPKETEQNETPIVEEAPIVWPSWNAAGTNPYFNGRPYMVGDEITTGARLAYYAPDRRSLVVAASGAWWVWIYGEDQPRRVGTFDDIRTAVQATRDSAAEPGPTAPRP